MCSGTNRYPPRTTRLRTNWPLAQIGFVVTMGGQLLCPSPSSSLQAQQFCVDNSRFLANREVAEPDGAASGHRNSHDVNSGCYHVCPSDCASEHDDLCAAGHGTAAWRLS